MPAGRRCRPRGGRRTRTGAGTGSGCRRCSSRCSPLETSAGMKKLVPSVWSSIIMMALTNSAGKREQRQDGGHEDAPHRQRQAHQRHAARARLQHRHHVVEAAHGEADDEEGERNEHQDDSPIRPGVPAGWPGADRASSPRPWSRRARRSSPPAAARRTGTPSSSPCSRTGTPCRARRTISGIR